MARNKTSKMTISFEKSDLIKALVGDIAVLENRSLSAVIERIVLNALLPKNDEAKYVIENSLYSENGSIAETLIGLFSNNAAGINGFSKRDNYLPLVEFAYKYYAGNHISISDTESEYKHTCFQFNSVVNIIRKESDLNPENFQLTQNLAYAESIYNDFISTPDMVQLINIFMIILSNWDLLKGLDRTYRLLMDLVILCSRFNVSETLEKRLELLDIIKSISSEWK